MFQADTRNRQRSGASVSTGYQYQNRTAGAARHSNVELVNAQHQGSGRPRAMRTPIGGGGSGFNYRGLFTVSPPSPYMTEDVVLLGAGTSAGMYISSIDNNTNLPDSGIGWIQISSFATWL